MQTELQTIINALLSRRETILEDLQTLMSRPATAQAADERIVDISNHRQVVHGRTQLTVELSRVDAALSRHAKGAFGLCCSCQLDIEPERLASDPTVAFCEACFEEVAEERRRQGYVVR